MNRQLLGRYVRARGRRWELSCRAFFEGHGFRCQRVEEADFGYGVDLLLFWPDVPGPLPVAIQCKYSRNPRNLFDGLKTARSKWPSAKFWVCLHGYQPQPSTKSKLTILYTSGNGLFQTSSFPDMIQALKTVLFKDAHHGIGP